MTSLSVKEIASEVKARLHYDEVSDQQREFWLKNGWWCSICKRVRYLRPHGRQDLCGNCVVSKESSLPISCSVEDWSKKLDNWSSDGTISLIPVEALAPYLEEWFSLESLRIKQVKSPNCSRGQKTYLMYLSSCAQVCREWRDYFNDPIFWKPAYTRIAVNAFYEKKKNLLLSEKKKEPRSKDWCAEYINANKCKMVVVNETDGIPFDIFWITNTRSFAYEHESCVQMGTIKDKYHCGRTYPNAKWLCIPTREWLIENKYSTVGFKWVIDVFSPNLKTFIKEDGNEVLAYVVTIRQPDLSKMHPIKGIDKDFENYRKKIIPLVFNEKEVEYEWKTAKYTRKQDKKVLEEMRKNAKEIRKGIELSEKKSDDQMYVLNMFN
jgi:hypothetical protein